MSEIYKATIPIIRMHLPGRPINTAKMVDVASEKVRTWLLTLTKEYTTSDTIQLTKFKLVEDDVELEYKITRNTREEVIK